MNLRHRQPRGSIYVLVLCTSMLVAVIGMGALAAARVYTRASRMQTQFAVARLCARAGLEMAMFRIRQDPTWRTDMGNGTWFSNVPLNQGTFTVSAADPVTGDVTVASNHPVVLTSTGTKGSSSYTVQATVQVNAAGLGCLNVAACSGSDTNFNGCTFTCNQIVSANGNVNIDGSSVVTSGVQAVGKIGGTTYGAQAVLNTALTLPDSTHVFDYYKANGTTIPLASLLQSNSTQLVSNTGFETDTSGWYVYSPSSSAVALSIDPTQYQDGKSSLLISGRAASTDVPATDLPLTAIRNGDTYSVQIPVWAKSAGTTQAVLIIQSTGGTQYFSTPTVNLQTGGGWVMAQGNLTISWSGVLTKATLALVCSDNTANLNIDKVSVTDTSLPSSAYVMDRVVLSPNSNPYGAANSSGIYIINCGGQAVTIGPCRIVGTLVLIGAGSGSSIRGPITWEPAVSGYPALLSDSSISISFAAATGLSESVYGINFNPAGTPYPYASGTSNGTASDGFPSIINGLIYCGGDLTFPTGTSPAVNGCIVTGGSLVLSCASFNMTYGNASYVAPPPGFSTSLPALYLVPGTWQRIVH